MDLAGGLQLAEYLGNAEGGNPDAPSLNASNGKKGVNNQTALVAVFGSKGSGMDASDGDVSPTLRAAGHDKSHMNGGSPPAIAFGGQMSNPQVDYELSQTLQAKNPQAVAFNLRGREGGNMPELGTDQASALRSADGGSSAPMAMTGAQVRRLTPIECERLQGFPDNWTLIPGLKGWRAVGPDEDVDSLVAMGLQVKVNKKTGRARVNDPDGPRYKALGNSFTTEPVNFIMSRVQASLRGDPMPDWQPMHLWKRGRL